MDDLLKRRAEAREAAEKKEKKRKKKRTISYKRNGKAKRGKMPVWGKILLGFGLFLSAILLFIYIPPFFYQSASDNSYIPIMPNAAAIKSYQTYLKDNPEADFDGDGMDNTLEGDYNTDIWKVDSDMDGVSDYAELYLTGTSPTEPSNILQKQMKSDDEKKETNIGTPYKLDDIIFWPDDYQAKAYGAVVKLSQSDQMIAYRFCYYRGYVRFPYDTVYVYRYTDGVHHEMKHKKDANAWYVDSNDEIRIYPAPLSFVHVLQLPFMDTIYLKDDAFGSFLTKYLPDKGGYVTCYKAATIDEEEHEENNVTALLRSPLIDQEDISRLTSNMNTLKDLSWVRKVIEAGHCIAVSMYSASAGESIGIIYGYTEDGDLLIANEKLEHVGKIAIQEMAMRMMDKEGTIGFRSWYEWKGLGFDSALRGDRINFFASTLTEVDDIYEEPDMQVQVLTEMETKEEAQTEAKQETEQETQTETRQETEQETQPATEEKQTQMVPETLPDFPGTTQMTEEETQSEKQDSVITFGL